MYIQSLLLAASACMRVAYADFYIITEPPVPLSMVPNFSDTQSVSEGSPATASPRRTDCIQGQFMDNLRSKQRRNLLRTQPQKLRARIPIRTLINRFRNPQLRPNCIQLQHRFESHRPRHHNEDHWQAQLVRCAPERREEFQRTGVGDDEAHCQRGGCGEADHNREHGRQSSPSHRRCRLAEGGLGCSWCCSCGILLRVWIRTGQGIIGYNGQDIMEFGNLGSKGIECCIAFRTRTHWNIRHGLIRFKRSIEFYWLKTSLPFRFSSTFAWL